MRVSTTHSDTECDSVGTQVSRG